MHSNVHAAEFKLTHSDEDGQAACGGMPSCLLGLGKMVRCIVHAYGPVATAAWGQVRIESHLHACNSQLFDEFRGLLLCRCCRAPMARRRRRASTAWASAARHTTPRARVSQSARPAQLSSPTLTCL